LLLKIDKAGHFGEGGFARLVSLAYDFAFLFHTMKVKHKPMNISE